MRVLSLGAGVQSTTVLRMIIHGELPPVEHAIFSDTGWEPQVVYDHLDTLRASYYSEHREMVADVGRNILAILAEDKVADPEEDEAARAALEKLRVESGYCDACVAEALSDLIRLRYDA